MLPYTSLRCQNPLVIIIFWWSLIDSPKKQYLYHAPKRKTLSWQLSCFKITSGTSMACLLWLSPIVDWSLHPISWVNVKTGSSRSGTDERGKCDSVGLSAACLNNEATIHSMVVVVVWVKADRLWEWLQALSCVYQHELMRVRVEPEGFRIGNENEKGQRDEGQRYGKYLRWLSDWRTRDKGTTTYTTSKEKHVSGQIMNQWLYVWRGTKYVMRVRWYRVDKDGELRVSDGGNEREVKVMYEGKWETGN